MKKHYIVTKSNSLIHSKYDLSLEEQRILLSIASLVQPEDEHFKTYQMSVSEFANLTNVEVDSKYSKLRRITKKLMSRVLEIEDSQRFYQLHWLSSCTYIKGQGIIELRISDELKPYMLQLKERFTTYHLSNILKMQSKYSIRMYEIMKAHQYQKEFKIDIDVLKTILKCESYKQWSHIRTRVIEPSVKEINYYTDLLIDYKPIKTGRSISTLEFTVKDNISDGELYGS